MTIKSFAFESSDQLSPEGRNWRQFDQASNFIDFSSKVTVGNITNYGSAVAWAQSYGPMVYYYIKLTPSAGNLVSAGAGYIQGMPFGAPSVSGLKATIYLQPIEVLDTNLTPIAATGQKGYLTYNGSTPRINLVNAFNTPTLYVYGWAFRDA